MYDINAKTACYPFLPGQHVTLTSEYNIKRIMDACIYIQLPASIDCSKISNISCYTTSISNDSILLLVRIVLLPSTIMEQTVTLSPYSSGMFAYRAPLDGVLLDALAISYAALYILPGTTLRLSTLSLLLSVFCIRLYVAPPHLRILSKQYAVHSVAESDSIPNTTIEPSVLSFSDAGYNVAIEYSDDTPLVIRCSAGLGYGVHNITPDIYKGASLDQLTGWSRTGLCSINGFTGSCLVTARGTLGIDTTVQTILVAHADTTKTYKAIVLTIKDNKAE